MSILRRRDKQPQPEGLERGERVLASAAIAIAVRRPPLITKVCITQVSGRGASTAIVPIKLQAKIPPITWRLCRAAHASKSGHSPGSSGNTIEAEK